MLLDLDPKPELNSYNVAQLQFALDKPELDLSSPAVICHALFSDDVDYDSRRMSTSASTDSSIGDKRAPSHTPSPQPKRQRPTISLASWDAPPDPRDDPKVQLPSILSFEDSFHHDAQRRASLPTLYSESPAARTRLPYPASARTHPLYSPNSPNNWSAGAQPSGLASYQFPPPHDNDGTSPPPDDHPRPRLSANTSQLGVPGSDPSPFPDNTPTTSSSSLQSSTFGSPLSSSGYRSSGHLSAHPFSPANDADWNASPASAGSAIVRPSSTPGTLSSQQMYAGAARIAGQSDRLKSAGSSSDDQWTFPIVLPSGAPPYPNNPGSVASSPARSPGAPPAQNSTPGASAAPSTADTKPPRRRGKLPKATTDFLKDWLHKHSDHPYPSEEEKKQLCHATGLSMSQVSNWMINARRRILAPLAHRAAAAPTTLMPYPRPGPALLDARRASMPNDIQLYHPLSLQSHAHPDALFAARHGSHHMLGLHSQPRTALSPYHSHSHTHGHAVEYAQHRLAYVPNSHQGSQSYMTTHNGAPLSAPPSMAPGPFSSGTHHQMSQPTMYAQQSNAFISSPQSRGAPVHSPQPRFYPDEPSQPPSGTNSGYQTPQ